MVKSFLTALLLAGLVASASAAERGEPERSVAAGPSTLDLVEVVDIAGLSSSPDGRNVVFRVERADLASNSYPARWYRYEVDSGAGLPIGSGGEAIYEDPGVPASEQPIWSGDGRAIFYRTLFEGEVGLWRAWTDGSAAGPVVSEESDIIRLRRSETAGSLLYDVGATREAIRQAEEAEYRDGILVDEHVDLAQNMFRGAIVNGRRSSQRLTGRWFERSGLLLSVPVRSRRLDLATLGVTDAASAAFEKPGGAKVLARSAKGDLAFLKGGGAGLSIRRAGGAETECAAPPCRERVAWAAFHPIEAKLVFATENAFQFHTLYVWDLDRGEVSALAQSDGWLNGGRDPASPCAVAASAVVCVAAEAASPPRVERIDLATGERTLLFDPNPNLRSRLALKVEHLSWTGEGGHRYTGTLLTSSRTGRSAPLFVTYYSCEGFLRGGLGDEWPLAPLAESGIAALCVNKARMEGPQDALANDRAAAEGVAAIVRRLESEGRVDPKRVGMGGLSFGSEATLWTAFNTDLLAALSVSSPALEPAYYWFNGIRGRDNHERLKAAWGLGAPDETPGRWKSLAPALNVRMIRAAVLMQMPEQEARLVPELYARLTHSATPAELYVFPEEPHIKFQPVHKLAVYRRNLDWFRFWLQGYSDPDPAKRAQYERWGALRARALAGRRLSAPDSQSSIAARSNSRK